MHSTLEDIFNMAKDKGYDLHINLTTVSPTNSRVSWWLFPKDLSQNYHNLSCKCINDAKEEILAALTRLKHGNRGISEEVA